MTRQRAWQLRKMAEGLCVQCGSQPRMEGKPDVCLGCSVKRKKVQREAYKAKRASDPVFAAKDAEGTLTA